MTKPQNTREQGRAAKRDARGKFVKGRSGNPGGRPTVAAEVKSLAQSHGRAAIARLAHLLNSADLQVSIAAAKVLLDRGYGRAEQSIAIDANIHADLSDLPSIHSVTNDPVEAARMYQEMIGAGKGGRTPHWVVPAQLPPRPQPEPKKPPPEVLSRPKPTTTPPEAAGFRLCGHPDPPEATAPAPPEPIPAEPNGRREPVTLEHVPRSPDPEPMNLMALLAGPPPPPAYKVLPGPRRVIPQDEGPADDPFARRRR